MPAAIDQGFPLLITKAFRDVGEELFGGVIVLLMFNESGGVTKIFFGEFSQFFFRDSDLRLEAAEFCGGTGGPAELFLFEGNCELFAEFADAFRGGGDFLRELVITELGREEFEELECVRPVFLISGE